jgi:hypothetical protein
VWGWIIVPDFPSDNDWALKLTLEKQGAGKRMPVKVDETCAASASSFSLIMTGRLKQPVWIVPVAIAGKGSVPANVEMS